MCAWIKGLFTLVLLGLVTYSAVQFTGPYYRELTFKSDVREILRFDSHGPDEVTAKILNKAKELHVPLDEENLSVTLQDGQYRAQASWSESVNLFNQYKQKLNFSFDLWSPKEDF